MADTDSIWRAIKTHLYNESSVMDVRDLAEEVADAIGADSDDVERVIESRMDDGSLKHENRSKVWLPA